MGADSQLARITPQASCRNIISQKPSASTADKQIEKQRFVHNLRFQTTLGQPAWAATAMSEHKTMTAKLVTATS